jgi:hypothetical protein
MIPNILNIEKSRLRMCRNAAFFAVLIASCAGPSAPSDPSDGSKEISLNKQTDTSQFQIHSKNSRSRDNVLGMNLFVVDNESSQTLGNLTISSLSGNQTLLVGPSQADSSEIPFIPGLVIMNLQTCLYPDTTIVTLPSGTQVSVGWQNPNLITVMDYGTQD